MTVFFDKCCAVSFRIDTMICLDDSLSASSASSIMIGVWYLGEFCSSRVTITICYSRVLIHTKFQRRRIETEEQRQSRLVGWKYMSFFHRRRQDKRREQYPYGFWNLSSNSILQLRLLGEEEESRNHSRKCDNACHCDGRLTEKESKFHVPKDVISFNHSHWREWFRRWATQNRWTFFRRTIDPRQQTSRRRLSRSKLSLLLSESGVGSRESGVELGSDKSEPTKKEKERRKINKNTK